MDAELFRPERWDDEMPKNNNPTNAKWGYLPFHGGPRICLGREFFELEKILELYNADNLL